MNKLKKRHRHMRDPNAQAMWGWFRNEVYRDRTKYTRKTKHKNKLSDE